MKKALALFLCFVLLIAVAACNHAEDADGDVTTTSSSTTATGSSTTTTAASFVKPEGCVSVVEVSINPLFRLYLNAEDVVLAVECVNADAATMEQELTVVSKTVDEAVASLVSAANDNGFVKADTVVELTLVESSEEDAAEMMNKAESAVATLADELEIPFRVTVATASSTATTTTTAGSSQTTTTAKPTSTSKSTTTTTKPTTTTTQKVDYQIHERTYFSYARPAQGTDYETGEEYLYLLQFGISFYPNGGSLMDGDWDEPIFTVSVNGYTDLIPKTDYPACQEHMVNYRLSFYTDDPATADVTWEDLFEDPELRARNTFVTANGIEYMCVEPGIGGWSSPVYSYTIDDKTGAVSFTNVFECGAGENCELISLSVKPNVEKALEATFTVDGKEETMTFTAR